MVPIEVVASILESLVRPKSASLREGLSLSFSGLMNMTFSGLISL